MGSITGIKVELDSSPIKWAGTADALFLGVYSKHGGREFRLNSEKVKIDEAERNYTLALGKSCCKSEKEIQVLHSLGLGLNDPLLNPIELNQVDFVYLRKETADSKGINDDEYKLDGCSVLLCDGSGLRRFRKDHEINFSDEAGLQHWLGEVAPPQCVITVTLNVIRHNDEAQKPAGRKWDFTFGFRLGGSEIKILDDHRIRRDRNEDEWHEHLDLEESIRITGCCGTTHDVEIFGEATEKDFFRDDKKSAHTHVPIDCRKEVTRIPGSIDFVVEGNSANRKSRITYEFEVRSRCL